MSETAENVLRKIIKQIVESKGPGFYSVKEIVTLLKFELGGESWVNPTSVGRMMRRMGFTETRRMETGVEYRLTKDIVK